MIFTRERLAKRSPSLCGNGAFTQLANLTGLPAMSVPMHVTGDGFPVGLQFIAPYREERLLISLASQIGGAFPWDNAACPSCCNPCRPCSGTRGGGIHRVAHSRCKLTIFCQILYSCVHFHDAVDLEFELFHHEYHIFQFAIGKREFALFHLLQPAQVAFVKNTQTARGLHLQCSNDTSIARNSFHCDPVETPPRLYWVFFYISIQCR